MLENKKDRIEEEQETAEICCVNCGAEIDEYSGIRGAREWFRDTRYVPYCKDCQEAYYEELAQKTTPHLALFYCCIAFNVPLYPAEAPFLEDDPEPWITYLSNLRRSGKNKQEDGEPNTFFDGVTDILKLFGGDLKSGEFAKAVSVEKTRMNKQEGTKRQRDDWGTIDGFTKEQFDELDRLYKIQSKPYEAVGIDELLEYNLREICKNMLRYSIASAKGKAADAKKYLEQAETIKASNLMRKKDEKPVEDLRVDTLTDKLEKKGFLKNGKLLALPELIDKVMENRPQYNHSIDAADQMMLCIINTMRKNAGLGTVSELPESMMIDAQPGEFLEEEPPWETDIKRKLEMLPLREQRKRAKGDPLNEEQKD